MAVAEVLATVEPGSGACSIGEGSELRGRWRRGGRVGGRGAGARRAGGGVGPGQGGAGAPPGRAPASPGRSARGGRGARRVAVTRSGRGSTCTPGSSCRPGSASDSSASAGTLASAGGAGAAQRDRRGRGAAELRQRWADGTTHLCSTPSSSGAAGGARAAAAHQPDSRRRRAGRPGGLAVAAVAATATCRTPRSRRPSRRRRSARGAAAIGPRRGSALWAALMQPDVRVRRAGASAVRRPPAPDRAHRGGGRDRADPAASRPAGRNLPAPRPPRAPPLGDGLPGVAGAHDDLWEPCS